MSKWKEDDQNEFFPPDDEEGCDDRCTERCDETCVDYHAHYNHRMQNTFGFQMSRDDTFESGFRGMYQV